MADLTLTRGDDEILTITVVDSAQVPVDLSSASVWLTIKRRHSDSDAKALVQKTVGSGIVLTDAVNGVCEVTVANADTAGLAPGRYVYDVQIKDASARISTVAKGGLTLDPDVTLATA